MHHVNRHSKHYLVLFLLLASSGFSGCVQPDDPASLSTDMNAEVNALADRYVKAALERQPEMAYFSGLPAPAHDYLADNSLAALADWQALEDELHTRLQEIDPAMLDAREWIAWGALKEMLEASRGERICRGELWQGVNHMFSWHLRLPHVAGRQPLETADDRAAALRRWSELPAYIDTEIANLREGLGQGYSAARPVAEAMLGQVEKMLASPVEQFPLYSMAQRTDDEEFHAALETVITDNIMPALQRYRDFMAETYIPAAREELSVTALPNGRECYAAMLRNWTTLDRTPEEVFALGEKTVNANLEHVLELGKREFGLDSIDEIVGHAQNAADNRFSSAEELVEHSRAIVTVAREKSAALFHELPTAKVVVEPFPEFQRGSGASSHYLPPGSKDEPGEYRISLDFWQEETVGNAEVTAVHETWPGHHLQIAMALALEDQHPITKLAGYSGYTEGWARYSEQLGEEAGIYTVKYAGISRRLWPARGMVADPGIHVKDWTVDQAAEFMAESGRFSLDESRALVTRIAAIPGQLTAYDSGALVIFALRREAEKQLGEHFDLREFHQRVLENGALPLWQLQDHVRDWIGSEAAAID